VHQPILLVWFLAGGFGIVFVGFGALLAQPDTLLLL
jgi:hypothetical protein